MEIGSLGQFGVGTDSRVFRDESGAPEGVTGDKRRCNRLICNGQPTHNQAARLAHVSSDQCQIIICITRKYTSWLVSFFKHDVVKRARTVSCPFASGPLHGNVAVTSSPQSSAPPPRANRERLASASVSFGIQASTACAITLEPR